MTKYSCENCKESFSKKLEFTKHQKNCITITEEITSLKEHLNMSDKTILINLFKSCLDILRTEGLTGDKALRNLSYLLILKLIEPRIGKEIDIDNYPYQFNHLEDKDVESHKKALLYIARFSNLQILKDLDIPVYMKSLWSDILSVHPSTKNIFIKDKTFDIKHQSTYKKLIDKINAIDFSKMDYDILGNAYEEVIQELMTGKVLGQFFTQPLVKNIMVKLINPQVFPDGKIESCADPTMGTGGFLISYLKAIKEKAKDIPLDWNYIINEGLYGKEIEPDTYQMAVSNMLISSGHMFNKLEQGDSIREPITRKFDNVLANPPFGIKGLKYDEFLNDNKLLKSQYVPIKTDNAVSLFIQAIIHMLKINGKCAVVLPDGQDLFSKSNATLVSIREYLMKTCDLQEIIYLPSGIFDYTSIKTCIFYFIKKREGSEILKVVEKKAKTKVTKIYQFSPINETKIVKFYNYDFTSDTKNLLVEVPIEKLVANSYSLNYVEYIKVEERKILDETVVLKTLGEICLDISIYCV
jgi:type I restriction enzyme M protein